MRILFFVFCLLLSTSCALQSSLSHTNFKSGCIRTSVNGVPDDSNFFASVVKLYSPTGACSATQVAPHIIVTAQHCVAPALEKPEGCTVSGPLGDSLGLPHKASSFRIIGDAGDVRGKTIFIPTQHNSCGSDFAVIITDGQAASRSAPVRLLSDTLPGEQAVIVGFGLSPSSHFGVRHYKDLEVLSVGSSSRSAPDELLTGGGAYPGDSGGALFSSETGALIGVTSKLFYVGDFDFNNPTGLSVFTQSQQLAGALFAASQEVHEVVEEEKRGECAY